jgi:hypothetical protein
MDLYFVTHSIILPPRPSYVDWGNKQWSIVSWIYPRLLLITSYSTSHAFSYTSLYFIFYYICIFVFSPRILPLPAVTQRLDAGFPPRRPGFAYGQHVGFVVDKAALGQVFSEYFGFPCQSFPRFPIIIITRGWHNRPLSGRSVEWTLIPPPNMQIINNNTSYYYPVTIWHPNTTSVSLPMPFYKSNQTTLNPAHDMASLL